MPHVIHQRTSGKLRTSMWIALRLEVARNRRNFRCARSQVAILLASLIFINSRRRQTIGTPWIVENKDWQLPISHLVNTYIQVRMTFACRNENGVAAAAKMLKTLLTCYNRCFQSLWNTGNEYWERKTTIWIVWLGVSWAGLTFRCFVWMHWNAKLVILSTYVPCSRYLA